MKNRGEYLKRFTPELFEQLTEMTKSGDEQALRELVQLVIVLKTGVSDKKLVEVFVEVFFDENTSSNAKKLLWSLSDKTVYTHIEQTKGAYEYESSFNEEVWNPEAIHFKTTLYTFYEYLKYFHRDRIERLKTVL